MSGATIGGIVGGVIGAFFGAPQVGFMIGSLIGGAVDPDVIKGPSLGDIPVQTSQEGVPRPIVFGSPPPFPGNIIQIGPKIYTTKRDRQGKGGGPIVESQEVYQSYGIRVCQGEATVVTVWRDGKVVFDRTGRFPLDVDGFAFMSRVRFYTGDEAQLPDPTFESIVGSGNQPAYRGTAYMVVTNDNLTKTGGRIPNYEFRMASVAEVTQDCAEEGLLWWYPLDEGSGVAREMIAGADGAFGGATGGGPALAVYSQGSTFFGDFGAYMHAEVGNLVGNIGGLDEWSISIWAMVTEDVAGTSQKWMASHGGVDTILGTVEARLALEGANEMTPEFLCSYAPGFFTFTQSPGEISVGSPNYIVGTWVADSPGNTFGTMKIYVNGALANTNVTARRPTRGNTTMDLGCLAYYGVNPATSQFIGYLSDWKGYNYALSQEDITERYIATSGDFWENPDAPGSYVDANGLLYTPCPETANLGVVTLAEVETEICRMAGISEDQINVTADTAVQVHGFLIGKQMPAAEALRVLGGAYFREYPEYDLRIVSTPRGGAVVADLTEDDCIDTGTDEETRSQPIDLPRKINMYFYDAEAGAVVPVSAQRTSINVTAEGIIPLQLPMTLPRDDAKKIAEIMLKVMWEEQTGTRLIRDLPLYQFAYLTPADPITFMQKRWRLVKTTAKEGRLQIEAVRDRVSNYSSTATANILEPPQTPVPNIKGPSVFVPMNLPALRTEDGGRSGVYGAVTGLTTGWPGCDVFVTLDPDADTWTRSVRMLAAATIGRLNDDVSPTEDSNGFLANPFYVRLLNGASLDSATPAQIAAGMNGFALTTAGVSDIGQFATALQDSDGFFEVTDATLGELGTTAAAHSTNDYFVILDTNLYFIELPEEWAGQIVYFKPVTIGTPLENTTTYSLLFDPPIQIIDGGEVT